MSCIFGIVSRILHKYVQTILLSTDFFNLFVPVVSPPLDRPPIQLHMRNHKRERERDSKTMLNEYIRKLNL
jgi:hypothetical protein